MMQNKFAKKKIVINPRPARRLFMKFYISLMLYILGKGFRAASRFDKRIMKELEALPEDGTFSLRVINHSGMCIKKKNKKLKYYRSIKTADVVMSFKTLKSAYEVLMFRRPSVWMYAKNGLEVQGDLAQTMAVMRAINLLQSYLLPSFITKKILKREPDMSFAERLVKRSLIYFRLLF